MSATESHTNIVFFWGHEARNTHEPEACLSQWHHCDFEVDGVWYNCAEQYMMAQKALLFQDLETYEHIMASYSPMEQKKLGRKVANYDNNIWESKRYDIVLEGNKAKFSQNPVLHDYLLSTGESILVEASPKDTIWGIGLAKDHPDVSNPKRWQGKNLLGLALMEVREWLKTNPTTCY